MTSCVHSAAGPYTLVQSVMCPRYSTLAALLTAVLLASCSLTTYGDDACTTNADCRAAFGFGATCGTDGLCAGGGQNPRCTSTFPRDLLTRPLNYTDAIVIGAIMNESDPSDLAAENAIELAVKQVNDFNGVNDKMFAVVFCTNQLNSVIDTATEEEATVATGLFLARDLGVPAIIGPSTSSQAAALYGAVAPLRTLMISHSATSTSLTQLDAETRLFWRTAAPDSQQGAAIADDLEARAVSTVAVIFEEGPYGTGLNDVFMGAFSGTATPFPFELGNATRRDAQSMAVAARAGEFGEILFISSNFADAQQFLRFAASFPGLSGKRIFLTDTAAGSPEFLGDALAAPLFPNIRGSRPALATGTVYDQFLAAYVTRFAMEPDVTQYQYAPYAYDAAWLVFAGAAWSARDGGVIRGSSMAEGLRHVSGTGPSAMTLDLLPGSWDALSMALLAGNDVNVNGASGRLDFDPVTDETGGPVEIWRIASGSGLNTIVVDRVVTPP